jgi:hypothetical protein
LIEILGFFCFGGILQRFDLGEEAVPAQATFWLCWHRDVRQLLTPATGSLLTGHRGSALGAAFFHQAMMAQ